MKKSHVLLLMLLMLAGTAMAQKKTITGKVVNEATNEPLEGVSILADKQKGGATTKTDGTYSIQVDSKTTTLIFSYVGFVAQTVIIGDKTSFDIKLVSAPTTDNEVVVIGYGTQRKSHLTGAVSKFKNEKLDETPVSRLDQALQGKIAGVQIQNVSSEAGSDPKILIRGLTSISASSAPLVVIDGHPAIGDGLAFINMADVESVEVLKDAASAAIYGSRGAAGVIMITTKSGKADKPRYSVKFSTGAKTAYERYPMMTTSEYSNMLFYEASLKAKDPSITPPTGTQIIANNERAAYIVENTIVGYPTDWQDQALRSATVRNLQVSVSGGSRTLKYFISGGYQRDQGLMYHSEYDKYNLRVKLESQLNKRIKLNFNINPSYSKRERPSVGFIDFVRFQSFLPVYHTPETIAFVTQSSAWSHLKVGDFVQARHFNGRMYSGLMPDGSMYTSTGNLDPFNTANNTPKSVMETRTITTNEYRVQAGGDITINIIPGLDFKAQGGAYLNYTEAVDFAKRNSNRDGDVNRGQYNNGRTIDLLSENTLTYIRKFGKHSLNALAGFTAQKTMYNIDQIVGMNFPSDNIPTANTATQIEVGTVDANGNLQGTFNTKNKTGLLSGLARIMYSFDNKYLLSASLRADGSSKFAPGQKWGYFPSISLGWMVTQEKFMQPVKWLNTLKLRTSYGLTGNNRIPDFAWIDLLYASNYSFGAGTGTVNSGQAVSQVILSNPLLTWERTYQFNSGIDVSLFRSAISLSVDVYQSKTEALLLKQSAMGFAGVPLTWNNIGKLRNNGVEVELTTHNIRKKDFKWSTTANFTRNRNKLLQLGDEALVLNQGERTELYMNKVGGPFIQFYGYKTDGVWLSQAQINEAQAAGLTSTLSNVFVPGGLKLVDINGDNKLDADDRTIIGNPNPDFTWGLSNNFTYKAFDLSFMLQGVQGGQLVNGDPNYNETKRYNKNYNTNRWLSPMFPGDGKTPYSTVGFNWMLTDYVVEDASYYCLREVIVGYTLPAKWAKALHLSSMRAYFSGQNLYFSTPSSYRGINTEARFTSGPYNTPAVDGYQRGGFPMPKTVLFGIDINF